MPDRVKGQTAIFEEMIEDEDGLVDDRLPTTSRGLWAASETERTLKAILSFAKAKRMDPELVEEGNTFMELFENWKKEYKVNTHITTPLFILKQACTACLKSRSLKNNRSSKLKKKISLCLRQRGLHI